MPWWLPATIAGATSLAQYAFRPKTPRFEETEYGKLLKKISERGLYSPQIKGKLIGQAGATTADIAQRERARIAGGLIPRGLYGSVAGLRTLGEPGRERMRSLGEYARQLDIESEMGKRPAEEALARTSTEWGMRRKAEEAQAKMGLLGGLGEAGLGFYRGRELEKLLEIDPETGRFKYPEIAPYVQAIKAGIRIPAYGFRMGAKEEITFEDINKMSDDEFMRWLHYKFGGGE